MDKAPLMCDLHDASILWTILDRDTYPIDRERQTVLRDKVGKLIRTLRDGQHNSKASGALKEIGRFDTYDEAVKSTCEGR